ncbi:hypothetical protein Zmor_018947 [Zophobas morio]|uniref:DNA/RNA non-specific endonuclease/pyrophosphatase/phosphodiesterase domain-containing protein n=1 Tax=Zophobas morio TaxID=2755281 RepID=A0AA38IDB0_9CUCU|nr:hypothetical protein Zmor_018947 [Zophobas morio]
MGAFLLLFLCLLTTTSTNQETCPGGTGHGNTILTNETCSGSDGQTGVIILITTNQIRVCFNLDTHQTIYTEHINPDLLYHSISSVNIDRGHLVPPCDFNTTEQQSDTYFYINAAPIVHDLYSGGWSQVEQQVRDLMNKHLDLTTHVLSTTYGTQCLVQGRLAVPTHFVKILTDIHDKEDSSMVVGDNSMNFSSAVILPDCEVETCVWMTSSYPRVYCCVVRPELMERLNLSVSLASKSAKKTTKRLFTSSDNKD